MVTGQAPVTLELRNTPGKKHKQTKGGTRIYHSRRNSCLRQKHIQGEIGSQPTMYQVHTGAYTSHFSRLEKPTIPLATQRKTATYILHVVPITTHTHVGRKSIGKKKQKNRLYGEKGKERKGKKRKEKKSEKGKERKEDKKSNKKQDKKRSKERKKEKTSY